MIMYCINHYKKSEIMNSLKGNEKKGFLISLWATALILIWLGIFKFTPTEAAAIKPLVEHHFLMGWLYSILSVQTVSNLVGMSEIIVGIALLVGLKQPFVGFWSGIAASVIFLVTLSFMFTTPGIFKVVDGVPVTEFFLFKDLAFLGISLSIIGRNQAVIRQLAQN
ncbi:Inner membrane protein YkgB [Yersinia ruckeri]|nr:Inner membrane protein YkgB [Yersinia ruckeri]KFE38489.1 membrane protein [Yersinia ruckeri]